MLLQNWESWKGPYKYSWPLTLLPNYKTLETWMHISQLKKAHLTTDPMKILQILKSNWLGREVTSEYTASSQDQECFFLLPFLSILFLILNPWRSLILLLTFCLALTWKDNATVHIPQAIVNRGNPTFKQQPDLAQCRWSSEFCPSQHSPRFPMPQFLWNKLSSPSTVPDSLILGAHLPASDEQLPNLRNFTSRHHTKKGTQAKVTRIKPPVRSKGPYSCHLSRPSLKSKENYQETLMIQKLASFGGSPSPWLSVSANWDCDQEPLLNSKILQNLLLKHSRPSKVPTLSGQSCSWWQDTPWLSITLATKCLCHGQHHLLYLDRHFCGCWDSATEDHWANQLA